MLFWILYCGSLYGQEDCLNGVDDDNDGLIDLWDQDCYCVQTNGTLFFSDFEEMSCCPWRFTIPNFPGGIDCLGGMSSATEATSDYFNTCNYIGVPGSTGPPLLPLPIPSGAGAVGTISTSTYVEYIGTCLPIELIGGYEYEFSMQVGFNSNLLCVSLSPFTVAIYGTSDCANYPVENDDCLNSNPDWYFIGTMTVSAMLGEWAYVSGTFTAPYNTAAIAFGGFCTVESTANNYHFFDDFMISGPGNPQMEVDEISSSGDCASGITLSTTQISGASYQWYLNGIAIAGATDPTYEIPAGGEGSYRVMTIKNGLCGVSLPFEVEIDENTLTWNEQIHQVLCFGESNGSIELMLPGNHPPYEINWSSGHNTSVAEELAPGNYTVTVTDAYGCFGTAQYTVTEPQELDVFITSVTQPGGSQNTGEATIAIGGGVPPYFIAWSSGGSGYKEKNLPPGNYTVSVTDDHGCIDTVGFSIVSAIQSQINYVISSCKICDGSININVIGGINPVNINIADQNGHVVSNTGVALNLCGENYIYTIIDGAGNKVQDTLNLENKNKPIIHLDSIHAGICLGDTSGLISVVVSGGIPTYFYKWSNGDSTAQIKKLLPGNYALTVTDLAGCIDTVQYQLDSLKPILTTIQTVAAGCTIGGEATALALQGNGPVKWKWSTGDTTAMVKNLLAGNYKVTVSDSLGCRKVDTVVIAQEGGITVEGRVVNSHCSETSDGEISLFVLASNGNVVFSWSNGETTPIIENLSVGIYQVTLTDELGCQSVQLYEVKEEPQAQLTSIISRNPCAGQSQASIQLSLQDENDYNFLWSDGSTGPNVQNLNEGIYQVTITDIYGCRQQLDIEVKDPPALVAQVENSPPRCFGNPDGFISITVTGGTGEPTNTINGLTVGDTINHLGNGNYHIVIRDENGCTVEEQISLNYISHTQVEAVIEEAACDTAAGGSILLAASGGMLPYSFRWSAGHNDEFLNDVGSGWYLVTITDQIGCEVTDSFYVPGKNGPSLQLSGMSPICFGENNGVINVDITSDSPPNNLYINGNEVHGNSIMNLTPGVYTIEIIDAAGCKASSQYEITEPPALIGNILTVMQPDKNTITGSAIIEAKGGTPPYRIEWDNGEKGAAAKELVPGNHLVTITDTLGCKTEVEVLIVKSKIYASAIATDNNCAGACKGSISIVIENEDGTERYVWSDGGSGKERSGLCAGEYTCTINDEYGNETILMDIVIDAPDQLKLLLGTVGESCPDKGDGKAWVDISGGTPGYTIYWDEKEGGDSVELKPGIHTLRIEDKNGCRTDSTLFIAARTAVEWEIKAEDILCEKKGKIMVSAATNELQTIGVNGQVYSFAGTLEVLISEPGKYALENYISDSCIIEKGELEIKELEWISGGQTGGRIVVKEGEFVSLDVSGLKIEGAYEMEWKGLPLVDCSEEDELGNCVRYEYKAEGPHNVAVEIKSKEGCDTVIRFDIVVILDNEVFLPNVFGSNDPMNFKPTDKHGNTYIDMFIIYDRWGNKVFTENEKEINQMLGWDGNLNGKRVESDVYMYMLSTIDNKGKKKLYSGDVTLIK